MTTANYQSVADKKNTLGLHYSRFRLPQSGKSLRRNHPKSQNSENRAESAKSG
jgi:hypothetical protein